MHNISNFFGPWDEKSRLFSRKQFCRVFITGYRPFRGIRWGKVISLSKKFRFFGIIFGGWTISLSFCKLLQSDVSKHRVTCVEKRNREKRTLKNYYSINFLFWVEKTSTFSKTVKHDSQNCSLRVQRKLFRNFPETTISVWKFLLFEREARISCQNVLRRVAKGAFYVSRATLWEKDDRSKLFCLWLL